MSKGYGLVMVLALAGCSGGEPQAPADKAPEGTDGTAAKAEAGRIDRATIEANVKAAINDKIDPCVDFYEFACGSWMANTKIPGDYPVWNRSFSEIAKANEEFVKDILEKASKDSGGNADLAKVGDYYATCLDEGAIEQKGLEPLKPWLAAVDAVNDAASLNKLIAKLQADGADVLFGAFVDQSFDNPEMVVLHLTQAGLTLPERDYYLSEDEEKVKLRAEYLTHVALMFELSGMSAEQAKADAEKVLAFETKLAELHKPSAELREVDKMNHPMDRATFVTSYPQLDWEVILKDSEALDPEITLVQLNVMLPEYFAKFGELVKSTPVEDLKPYLRHKSIEATVGGLPKPLRDANFDFMGKKIAGMKEQPPRWKTCVRATEGAMGELLGKIYVDQKFGGDSKAKALEMIVDVEESFESGLPELKWMDDSTREKAKEKAKMITNKIGYPDKWRDYSSLTVTKGDHFANLRASNRFETVRVLKKVGKPPVKTDWLMDPQEVNAYYNPGQNEIAFPAGILQAPFFHRDYPSAMNYGAMGLVMGHEITHGFDDEGRKFDGTGRLKEWWAPEVSAKFEEAAACIEKQYNGYEPLPGKKVDGKLTLGENIADNGGLKQAFRAYQTWAKEHGAEEKLGGFTPEQQFFLSHAQAWCSLITPETAEIRLKTDPHAPAKYRVNGPLANFPAFAEAFQCASGTPMHPAEACEVW